MGSTARQARDVVALVEKVAAVHLLALCQAADLRGPGLLGQTRVVYDRVRSRVPVVEADREMDVDIATVVETLHGGTMLAGVVREADTNRA